MKVGSLGSGERVLGTQVKKRSQKVVLDFPFFKIVFKRTAARWRQFRESS
jgi:hypothetical protein